MNKNQPEPKVERPLPVVTEVNVYCYLCDRPIEAVNNICDICASPRSWNGKVYV